MYSLNSTDYEESKHIFVAGDELNLLIKYGRENVEKLIFEHSTTTKYWRKEESTASQRFTVVELKSGKY
jgi:hypothetical protein